MRWSGGGGIGSAASATPASPTRTSTASSRRLWRMRPPRVRPRGLELHLRDGLAARRGFEEGLLLEAAQRRDEAGGEDPDAQVVFAHGLVEALALHRDAVLRAFELALESQEVLVALELGIALDGHE